MEINQNNLENPPAWLIEAVKYLKEHAKETRITPKALAQRWEAKVGRTRSVRLRIAEGLLLRSVSSFKDLSQGEINALAEICKWICEGESENDGDDEGWNVRSGREGDSHS